MLKGLKWLAVGAVIGGAFLTVQGWNAKALWERLDAAGQTTEGILESGEVSRGRRGSKTYRFEVDYTPAGGTAIRKTFVVTKEYAQSVTKDDQIVSDRCVVRYDPSDPTVAILVGGSSDQRGMFPVGIALLSAGLLSGLVMLLRRAWAEPPIDASNGGAAT
ncbi:MAG: DUF3592 domain-containing protein [Planctomycetes bacterium]|nr:DUF3592 domain-containing protein [Planctomycetota bacterium]